MKDDHEGGGARAIMGAVIILILVLIFVVFGRTIIDNVNAGNRRNELINNAANDAYTVNGPDL